MASPAKLKLYVDRISQPCRAVLIFCKVNGIDFEEVSVDLSKGQQLSPDFLEINPMGLVPAIVHGEFKLFESHAILRYLAYTSPGIPDHWYPAEPYKRAQIDSILDWHHTYLRRGAVGVAFNGTIAAPVFGLPLNLKEAERAEKLLSLSLSKLESFWLDGKEKFLLGSPQPSIADLSLVCEIMQLQGVDDKEGEGILGPYRRVRQWIEAVKSATNPHFEEFHEVIYKIKGNLEYKPSNF